MKFSFKPFCNFCLEVKLKRTDHNCSFLYVRLKTDLQRNKMYSSYNKSDTGFVDKLLYCFRS